MGAKDFRALGLVIEEVVHFGNRAVEGHHGKTVVVHVQNQILAHHGQTDECDISLWFHLLHSFKIGKHATETGPPGPAVFCQLPAQICRSSGVSCRQPEAQTTRRTAVRAEYAAAGEPAGLKKSSGRRIACPRNRVCASLWSFLYRETDARRDTPSGAPFPSAERLRSSATL